MALVIQIILGLALLTGLVAIFFAAKQWHWSNIVLVVFILLTGAGYLYLAKETVRIHRNLRSNLARIEQNIATLEKQNEVLLHGSNEDPGIQQLEHELRMKVRERGRAWRQAAPAGQLDPQGRIAVTLPAPLPHGLAADTIIYVFEEGIADPANPAVGKQYLGEFRVVEATDTGVVLDSVNILDQRTGERIARSQGPWSLYESMPGDRYKTFEGMDEAELRKRLPANIVEQYIRHGQEATPDDDPRDVVGYDANDQRLPPDQLGQAVRKVYNRPLRDYAYLFSELSRQKVVLLARVDAVREDNAKLEAALASAQKLSTFREEEKQLMQSDLAGMKKDREAIESHLRIVQTQLENARKLVQELLNTNVALADELAEREATLKQMIDAAAPAPTASLALP